MKRSEKLLKIQEAFYAMVPVRKNDHRVLVDAPYLLNELIEEAKKEEANQIQQRRKIHIWYRGGFIMDEEYVDCPIGVTIAEARAIAEDYDSNRTPVCFSLRLEGRTPENPMWVIQNETGQYFLGGKVFSLEQLEAENNEDYAFLIENLKAVSTKYRAVQTNAGTFQFFDINKDFVL